MIDGPYDPYLDPTWCNRHLMLSLERRVDKHYQELTPGRALISIIKSWRQEEHPTNQVSFLQLSI